MSYSSHDDESLVNGEFASKSSNSLCRDLGILIDPEAILAAEDGLPLHPAILELRSLGRRWVAWRLEYRNGPDKKPTKPPVNPRTGGMASHSNPATWGTYEETLTCKRQRNLEGVGIVLTDDDEYGGFDLDNCRDKETGEIAPWAQAILDLAETYAEVSPSGTGIRMLSRGKPPKATKVDAAGIEIYATKRYLTITGDHVPGTPDSIEEAPKTYTALLARAAEFNARKVDEARAAELPRPAAQEISRTRATAADGRPGDFFRAVNDAALANLSSWVPSIFPGARTSAGTSGYRITSRMLGRDLQEDLSITPQGITDFGVADMGDAREGRRTAIDIAMEYGGASSAIDGAFWLCEKLGRSPESLGWLDDQPDAEMERLGKAIADNLDRYAVTASASPSIKTLIVPVPADAPPMQFRHPRWGEPDRAWPYHDGNGGLVGHVAYWGADDSAPQGHVAHITFCDLGGGRRGWRMKPMPQPRPLFDLPALLARPEAEVVLCADERAAEAAQILLPDKVATTTAHDNRSPASADFSPLSGRTVIIATSTGRNGQAWGDMLAAEAERAGAAVVKSLNLVRIASIAHGEAALSDGWSLASAIDDGVSEDALRKLLADEPEIVGLHRSAGERRLTDLLSREPGEVGIAEDHQPLFRLTDRGVEKLDRRTEAGVAIEEYRKICSPLAVLADTRNEDGRDWGRLLQIIDRDANMKEWAMPMSMLGGDGTDYRRELLSLGLVLAPGKFAREALHEYISTTRTQSRALCVSRTGWHDRSYVCARETLRSSAASERIVLQMTAATNHTFKTRGTLGGWQESIARPAIGNSRLVLAISAGFAAPLLHLTDAESGGIHFLGGSSTGKSTALFVAGSVWGGGGDSGFLRTWRATSNGLEGVAAMHCDALLCLDELGQIDGREAGASAYMLANGSGKSRAGQAGEARAAATWRLLFLSSGEIGLADKMAEDGKGRRIAAGQEVRIVDIPVDAGKGMGIFEELHDAASADAFARQLKEAARHNYGHASRAFIRHVVDHFDVVQEQARTIARQFVTDHCPRGADGQVSRVASRFGLIAAAGEIARGVGILPWPEGEATRAAIRCFSDWLNQRGGTGSAEEREAIARVRLFIEQHGMSRFEPIHPESNYEVRITDRVGFRSGNISTEYEYFVLPEAWKSEVCKGMNPKVVAETLLRHGFLRPELGGQLQLKRRLPGFANPVRCYAVSSSIMGDGDA